MKCTIPVRPQSGVKPLLQIPRDAEALALLLVEHVPPAMRRELGCLLLAVSERQRS